MTEMKSHFFFSNFLQCGFIFHFTEKKEKNNNALNHPVRGTGWDSPLVESALRFLQLGLQVSHRHLFLLQGSQILLWIWGLDPMILTAGHVPSRPPETAQVTECYL